VKVKAGAEFAIDAPKKIEIEGGGDTDRVVVRINQCLNGFEHVRAEEKRVPGPENMAQIEKKVRAGGAIEVADGAAEEEDEKMLARSATGSDFAETVEVFTFEADDADAVDVAEFTAKYGERGG